MQIEFNKNLAQTLNEKKKELKQLKEVHYGEITSLKHKMNDAVSIKYRLCQQNVLAPFYCIYMLLVSYGMAISNVHMRQNNKS